MRKLICLLVLLVGCDKDWTAPVTIVPKYDIGDVVKVENSVISTDNIQLGLIICAPYPSGKTNSDYWRYKVYLPGRGEYWFAEDQLKRVGRIDWIQAEQAIKSVPGELKEDDGRLTIAYLRNQPFVTDAAANSPAPPPPK